MYNDSKYFCNLPMLHLTISLRSWKSTTCVFCTACAIIQQNTTNAAGNTLAQAPDYLSYTMNYSLFTIHARVSVLEETYALIMENKDF